MVVSSCGMRRCLDSALSGGGDVVASHQVVDVQSKRRSRMIFSSERRMSARDLPSVVEALVSTEAKSGHLMVFEVAAKVLVSMEVISHPPIVLFAKSFEVVAKVLVLMGA